MARSIRKTVNLEPADAQALERLLQEDTPERRELAHMAGESALPYGDSAAIAALMRIGMATLRERMVAQGYEELAASISAEDADVGAWATESSHKNMMTDGE